MNLLNNPVCVAVDHKYSENNGAWTEFTLFDGVEVTTVGGMYADLNFNKYEVNATLDQIVLAARIANENALETYNYNKYDQCETFIGCIVILKGSRKAPNKTPLLVTDFNKGFFDNINYRQVPTTIRVRLENGDHVDVSLNCLNEVVKGVKARVWWTPTQDTK